MEALPIADGRALQTPPPSQGWGWRTSSEGAARPGASTCVPDRAPVCARGAWRAMPPQEGTSPVDAPSIQLVQRAVVRAVQALLHVVLKEPVLERRPRQTAVEHADADQRARSNGVVCNLQRHLKGGGEWGGRVFVGWAQMLEPCLGARIRKACHTFCNGH